LPCEHTVLQQGYDIESPMGLAHLYSVQCCDRVLC